MVLKIFTTLVAALTLSMSSVCQADTPSPKAEIQKTLDSIIATVQANPGDAAKPARREKLREIINPKFDFDEMSRRSLGSNWNEITPAEQKDFTTVFSELLARTYLSKIETVKPGMVKVESEQVEGPKAVVKTVVLSQGDTFPIDYKMMYRDNGWRVYDVVIENIGLVANYRNEFSGIIRKDKFSGLMEKLRAKVK
jgi:phospholipid transport system substrate-binding protein